jgi:phosphopantothenoylcysteine synthetase/decarboxylase
MSLEYNNDKTKIKNPQTGRWVSLDGRIAKSLLKKHDSQQSKTIQDNPKQSNPIKSKTIIVAKKPKNNSNPPQMIVNKTSFINSDFNHKKEEKKPIIKVYEMEEEEEIINEIKKYENIISNPPFSYLSHKTEQKQEEQSSEEEDEDEEEEQDEDEEEDEDDDDEDDDDDDEDNYIKLRTPTHAQQLSRFFSKTNLRNFIH